jgi:hypothetical protein
MAIIIYYAFKCSVYQGELSSTYWCTGVVWAQMLNHTHAEAYTEVGNNQEGLATSLTYSREYYNIITDRSFCASFIRGRIIKLHLSGRSL